MKPLFRYLLAGLGAAAVAALTLVLVHKARQSRLSLTCTGVEVHIKEDWQFVTEDDVKGWLTKIYGPYIGQRLDSVRLCKIESILERQSAVLTSEAWTDTEGILHIGITQREPVLRLQQGDNGFYVDERGCIFPLQRNYTSRVPVVDGALPLNIPAGYKGDAGQAGEWLSELLTMTSYLRKSRLWSDNIVQIHVREDGDIVMIPREGREQFIFGSPSRAPEKFARMEEYYRSIKPAREDGYYRSVNVKYRGQIICRK